MTAGPPDLCGWRALETGRLDNRWIAVKDSRLKVVLQPPGRFSQAQKLVNERLAYTADPIDRWDKPVTAWANRTGDCEEFAICKRAVLKASGIPDDDLFFVLGNDLIRRQCHAILIARQGNVAYVLDLQGPVYDIEDLTDFVPIAAYTGTRAWIFGQIIA